MKKLFSLLAIAVLTLTAISFQSCKDEKYTVWTASISYSEYLNIFGSSLDDGNYIRFELTNEKWEIYSQMMGSENKHRRSEEEIKKWLVGEGFGDSEATKESSWLTTVDHGMIVARDGYIVSMILK